MANDIETMRSLQKLFENGSIETEEEKRAKKEKQYIQDASKANAILKHGSTDADALKAYNPADLVAFLEKPAEFVKAAMGGEWELMSNSDFENLTYSVIQKMKKSMSLIDWRA